jgi:hypothetical protein
MRIWKNETARFMALGFAGGAALVLATMGVDSATKIANGIVPPANAATSQ